MFIATLGYSSEFIVKHTSKDKNPKHHHKKPVYPKRTFDIQQTKVNPQQSEAHIYACMLSKKLTITKLLFVASSSFCHFQKLNSS